MVPNKCWLQLRSLELYLNGKNVVTFRYWLWDCKYVSKIECWCASSGLFPVNREHPRIMRHNAAWDGASCWINPKLYPKPKVNILLGAARSSPWPLTPESLGLERRWSKRLNIAAAAAADDDGKGSAEDLVVVCLRSLLSSALLLPAWF